MTSFLVEGCDFRHLRTTLPDLISDEGVAFSAAPLPISDEGVAFSAAFQAKGLHFRPLARGWGAFLAKGLHFLPQTAPHESTCRIGQKYA